MLKIGSHVSSGGKGLLTSAEEAVSYGSSSFMLYTGAPQNTRRKPIEEMYVEEGKAVMKDNNIEEIVVHAPYIINLASHKESTFELAVSFLQQEIHRTDYLGVRNIVLHPGAYTEMDLEYGINRIAEGLNEVLDGVNETAVHIALETMAGKGTEIGRSFEELAGIMDKVKHNERLTVCMDTCHIHDAGYDLVNDLDGVLTQFDRIIGLDKLGVIHLNDSKNPRGAGKDRHTPLGSGYVGFEAIRNLVNEPRLQHLPMILETPWIGKNEKKTRPMYEVEIALLRGDVAGRFGDSFLEDVEQLQAFFQKCDIDPRAYVLSTWDMLKGDAKARKEDGREPLERMYDMVQEQGLLSDRTEEQLNHRLIGLLAGKGVLQSV